MAYSKTTWANGTTPAINAANLNKIEQGIEDSQNQVTDVWDGDFNQLYITQRSDTTRLVTKPIERERAKQVFALCWFDDNIYKIHELRYCSDKNYSNSTRISDSINSRNDFLTALAGASTGNYLFIIFSHKVNTLTINPDDFYFGVQFDTLGKSILGNYFPSIDTTLSQESNTRLISKIFPASKKGELLKLWLSDPSNYDIYVAGSNNSDMSSPSSVVAWSKSNTEYIHDLNGSTKSYFQLWFAVRSDRTLPIKVGDVFLSVYSGTKVQKEIANVEAKLSVSNNQIADDGFYPSFDGTLTQYSTSRLATKVFPASKKSEIAKLWLSDSANFDIFVSGSNSQSMSSPGTVVNWSQPYATYKENVLSSNYAYFILYFAVRSDRTLPINVGDVLFTVYNGTGVQGKLTEIDQHLAIIDEEISNITNQEYAGKTFAVLCDSIGTHGNSGAWANVPELIVTADDVGHELSAYVTYYDLYTNIDHNTGEGTFTGLTIGGISLDDDDIGTEITFTPSESDIGKSLGNVFDWNGNSLDVWWVKFARHFGMTPIPVCWASSSYSSHEESVLRLKCAYAWHESQIRKIGVRAAGSMTRIAPDYVILARGVNDLTHSPYTKLTDNFFNDIDWHFPNDDVVTGGFGLKEAISKTIEEIWSAYPNTKIILCTIPYVGRIDYNNFPTNNDDSSYPQWNDAIRECADFFGCGLIDFSKDGITHSNLSTYAPDLTHPNALGHSKMAERAIKDFTG